MIRVHLHAAESELAEYDLDRVFRCITTLFGSADRKPEELEKQVLAIGRQRSEKGVKIDWQFSIESARSKLNRHYEKVNSGNIKRPKI